jgi:hypothetical protein
MATPAAANPATVGVAPSAAPHGANASARAVSKTIRRTF